jgi:hypothetical protein
MLARPWLVAPGCLGPQAQQVLGEASREVLFPSPPTNDRTNETSERDERTTFPTERKWHPHPLPPHHHHRHHQTSPCAACVSRRRHLFRDCPGRIARMLSRIHSVPKTWLSRSLTTRKEISRKSQGARYVVLHSGRAQQQDRISATTTLPARWSGL